MTVIIIIYIIAILYPALSIVLERYVYKKKEKSNPLYYINPFLSTLLLTILAGHCILVLFLFLIPTLSNPTGLVDNFSYSLTYVLILTISPLVVMFMGLYLGIGICIFFKYHEKILGKKYLYYIMPFGTLGIVLICSILINL